MDIMEGLSRNCECANVLPLIMHTILQTIYCYGASDNFSRWNFSEVVLLIIILWFLIDLIVI